MSRLPGDIEGLLRRGSPVVCGGDRGIVKRRCRDHLLDGEWVCCWDSHDGEAVEYGPDLDLTDPTGRAHAAAWVEFQGRRPTVSQINALHAARRFHDMTPDQIDTLRLLVLRLAGREET